MCLIAVAYRASSRYVLTLAANRDERHGRPSLGADWWRSDKTVLGGRDLLAGGSWLAINRAGRVAAVTNFASSDGPAAARSRGRLVADFMDAAEPLDEFSRRLEAEAGLYAGFNLLLFDGSELRYLSNRAASQALPAGVHSLSNQALGADWPKLGLAERSLNATLDHDDPTESLLEFLATRIEAGPRRDQYRRSPFIAGGDYGTRASTIILIDPQGRAQFVERSFDAEGRETGTRRFRFMLDAGS